MIIVGAGGHAKEIYTIYKSQAAVMEDILFFDNVTENAPESLLDNIKILKRAEEVKKVFETDNRFILGIGNPIVRRDLNDQFTGWGGHLCSSIASFSSISKSACLGEGLNIMPGAVILGDAIIGTGSIIHSHVSVHHDCKIGLYCELSPGCRILGNVTIGDFTRIGSNAILLPGVTIGEKAIIGAGSVVTKDIPDGVLVKGVPGRW